MPTQRRADCKDRFGLFLRCLPSAAGGILAVVSALFAGSLLFLAFSFLLPSSLYSRGEPAPDPVFSPPDTASFSLTRVGRCDTLLLPMTNNGIDGIVIDSVIFSAGSSSLFLVAPIKDLPLGAGGTEFIRVAFCPEDTSCVAGSILIYGHFEAGEGIVHRIGLQACGGAPFIKVDPERLDFDSVAVSRCRQERFTVMNVGNYPLRVNSILPSHGAFAVISPSPISFSLPPHGSRAVVVEFCPDAPGVWGDSLLIVSDADNPASPVDLFAVSYVRQLLVPELLDVGSVPVGSCVDTFLVVKNTGTAPITLTGVSLSELPLPSGFSLDPQFSDTAAWERTLLPQETLQIPVRFCPTEKGERFDSMLIRDERNDQFRITMLGRGLVPFAWLDTVDAVAGEIGTLTFRIGPKDAGGIGPYRVKLLFDPDALFPVSVEPSASNSHALMSRPGKGVALIEGDRPAPVAAGDPLFTISFRGLSSGRPINRVEIALLEFPASPTEWDTLHGMVRLSGCDVGKTPGNGKRAHISSVGPNPAGESVVLRYQAPQGRISSLTIFDAGGSRVTTLELPEGTGETQEFRLDLSGLPRGLYTMELREREERSWSILLIDR